MEFLIELLLLYLFRYPGALIRFIFFKVLGHKKKYKEYLNDDTDLNIVVGLITIILIILLFLFISYY